VANQREHIILLLANADVRKRNDEEYDEVSIVVDNALCFSLTLLPVLVML